MKNLGTIRQDFFFPFKLMRAVRVQIHLNGAFAGEVWNAIHFLPPHALKTKPDVMGWVLGREQGTICLFFLNTECYFRGMGAKLVPAMSCSIPLHEALVFQPS